MTRSTLLAIALCAAAMPANAQGAREFRTSGFALTLPAGFATPERRPEVAGPTGEAYLSRGKDGFLVMLDLRGAVPPADTTLAARRAVLAQAARGAVSARGLQVEGGPEERVTADAVIGRFRVMAPADPGEKPGRGLLDVIVPRHGDRRLLMVGILAFGGGPAEDAETLRALESFRPLPLAPPDLFAWIAGHWRWSPGEGGSIDPFTLAVAEDRRTLTLTFRRAPGSASTGDDSVFVYRVLGTRADAIETEMVGESRKTTAGEVVRWDFVRLSEDGFCWRRSDWAATGCMRPILRVGGGDDKGR
jgi:hypothetical protein